MTTQLRSRNPTQSNIIKISTHKQFKFSQEPKQYVSHKADPVRDKETLEKIKSFILSNGRYGYRNWLVFVFGINSARRCGDILSLRIGELYNPETDAIASKVTRQEEKTRKVLSFYIASEIGEAIKEYIHSLTSYSLDDPLFKSQKNSRVKKHKDGTSETILGGFMSTQSYWKILSDVKKELELNLNFSTHTMRMTFGSYKYQVTDGGKLPNGYDVVDMLQEAYGHSSRKVTLGYLGITKQIQYDLYNTNVL